MAIPPLHHLTFEALRQGLRDLGYTEGKNILVEYRSAEGKRDRVPGLLAELVQLKVDVLVLPILEAIRATKEATKMIPIVMVTTVDPVATAQQERKERDTDERVCEDRLYGQ